MQRHARHRLGGAISFHFFYFGKSNRAVRIIGYYVQLIIWLLLNYLVSICAYVAGECLT